MSKATSIVSWVFAVVTALVYLQTLFFKFAGAEESIYIFTKVAGESMEAVARIGSGLAELLTAVLILMPKTRVYGAILSVFVISGAILSHLAILGIVVMNDNGLLFFSACSIFGMSIILIAIHRSEIPFFSESS